MSPKSWFASLFGGGVEYVTTGKQEQHISAWHSGYALEGIPIELVIKRATINDVTEIAKLFNAYRLFHNQHDDLALATEFLTERVNNSESVIFYAKDADCGYVGFVSYIRVFVQYLPNVLGYFTIYM